MNVRFLISGACKPTVASPPIPAASTAHPYVRFLGAARLAQMAVMGANRPSKSGVFDPGVSLNRDGDDRDRNVC